MGRPEPCILFAQSFIHSQLDEYVDEVVFSEPVVVTACEFLEQNASPSTPNISITGATSPPSFALELFVHCEGESRFRRLCQPFLYSHSSSNVLEVEAVVTSHLVLRGSYRSLTLVVYGNTAEDLGQFNLEFDLDNSLSHVVCSPSKGRLEDLPPALRSTKLTFEESLSSLGNLSFPVPLLDLTTEMKQFLLLVLKISQTCNNEDAFCKIVSIVMSFISSYVESVNGKSNPCDYHKMSLLVDGKPDLWHASHILSDAKSQLLELYNNHQLAVGLNQLLEGEIGVGPEGDKPTSELLMEMFSQCFPFLAKASVVNHPFFSQKKSIIFALGVALIFCSSRESCFCFVSTGGMEQLVDLLCNGTENSPAIVLLLLHVFEAATCHGVGCEGFLGWWPREDEMVPVGNSDGYCHLLKLLLNRQRHDIASLATYILQRLRFYEIASKYESVTVSILANTSADSWVSSDGIKSLVSASSLLKQILKLLKCEPIEDPSSVAFAKKLYPHGQMEGLLSYGATVDFITSSNYAFVKNDVDTHLLFLLKERGFFPLSAALLSSPILRSEDRNIANVFIDIASSLESILLELLCSRSGLTFLLTESEATALLMYSLQANTNTSNIECLTLRQAAVFLSKGFFCRPQEAGMITDLHLRVGTAVDRLLRAAPSSDDLLWLLWELCAISRSDSGRQAVLAVGYFPEAVNILMEALQSCKTVEPIETGALQSSLAIFHSASEILEILVMDSTASSLRAWIRHAMELHKALHSASPGSSRKDAPTRLLEFIDAGVVYHQNGAIGLLKYAAVLASGGDAHLTSATVLVSDSIDAENIIGDSLNGSDSHVVDNLLGKLVSEKQLDGIALHDCSIVKLTTAFRILAFISDNSVVTASLYEEGAITLVYVVLVNCKFMLERLSSTYDYLVDEGTECNSTSDLLSERSHERSIIDLLVPCLVLLVNLLRKLQETKEQYRNKKLLNSLLKLHREISPKLVANSADLLYPYPSSALGFAAVCHLLTSALACWPVFGWTPGIFHHLLESVKATSLLALGPKDACSVLCLLGDLFPVEDIWQWRNEMPRLSALRTLGVGTILGPRAEHDVNWYLQPDQLAVLLVRLTPQLDRIAQLVLQLAFTTLLAIQDSLRVLIIRVACQRIECAIVLVRPMISWMDGHLSQSVLSDADIFKVYKLLSFAASLLEHFCAKPLLLKVGILRILQKALERCSNASHSDEKLILEESISLKDISLISWCLPTFKSLALIFSSRASSCHSELDEKCFDDDIVTEDYSVVAHHLLKLCQVLPVGRELLACMLAFKEFVSSNWGFCAVSSILSRHDSSHEECGPDERDTNGDVPDELDLRCFPCFLNCLKKLSRFMNSKDWGLTLVVEILNALAMNALFLAKEDEISEGLPILKSLFGLPHGIDEAKGSYNEKLRYVQELIEDIEQKVSDDGYFPSSGGARTWHQVKQALRSILILLEHSASSVAKFEGVDFSEEFNSPSDLVHSVIITSRLMQPITLTSMDDGAGLLFSDVWESSGNIDTIGSDLFGSFADRYVWECPYSPPDRQLMPLLSVKRKLTAADGSGKRARDNSGLDAIGSSMPSRSVGTPGISSGPTRRDTFRQRKPNTSRPPSMHVDDYVARERNIDSANSGSNVGNTTLRGSGRPPSIHVDEFMARQRERQHSMSMVVGDASQFRDVSEVRILSQENSKNPDKLEMPRQMKADLDDDQEINIVFDEEPEPDDRLPFPQTDDSLQPSAVVGESSPGSVVEESEGDPNQSIHRSRLSTPPTSEDVGSRSDVPLKRSTSRPEMSMIHDVSSSQKIFAGPSMDKTILREQSDESKYASPRRFDTLAATNSTGFPSHSTNVCSTPSSIQPSALLNYHQKSSPQKASDSLLPVGVQGYSEQKLPANQPPLPPMPPPTRLAASAQAADSVQNLSSPYLQTIREMQPPLPTGYPLQSVNTSGNSNASGLHHQMENISSVGNSSASSLTTPQPIMDSKYSWNMVSSASKLQAESFIPSTSVRTMPPLPPLPPPYSSPNVQSSAANSSPQTSLSHPQPSDANFGVFPPPGSTLASYAIPPFSTSLLIGRPPSSPGNLFASQTQQHGQNSSSLNRSAPGPQSSVQSMQPRPPPPPPPQLPRPLHPPQHPLPSIQVSQPQPEQVMQQQQSPFQLQMQPLQIPQQLHIPQIQFYYHQPPPQEPHLQALQPFLDQTQSAGFQADNAPQHQKESGMTLQQYFSSPEAIQSLLSDRDKLCQLLEQHPKLMQMLQERLGQQ